VAGREHQQVGVVERLRGRLDFEVERVELPKLEVVGAIVGPAALRVGPRVLLADLPVGEVQQVVADVFSSETTKR